MKTLIVYHSEHHGNTKKLLDAIAEQEGPHWSRPEMPQRSMCPVMI